MRNEILKFRSWDGLNKKMEFWTLNDLILSEDRPSPLDKWMQSIDLHDQNGKEIYEGDILEEKFSHCLFQVEYDDCSFKMFDGGNPSDIWDNIENLTIVGNIYENLELIEKIK